jgi:hypothetical protein
VQGSSFFVQPMFVIPCLGARRGVYETSLGSAAAFKRGSDAVYDSSLLRPHVTSHPEHQSETPTYEKRRTKLHSEDTRQPAHQRTHHEDARRVSGCGKPRSTEGSDLTRVNPGPDTVAKPAQPVGSELTDSSERGSTEPLRQEAELCSASVYCLSQEGLPELF